MAKKFKREDARTCFRCNSKPPLFRVISIEKTPTDNGSLEPDCLVGLFCDSCLRMELNELSDGFAQSSIPVGVDESPDLCRCRQIGFAVIPLLFSQREAELLIDELRTDGVEMAVN